MTKPMKKRTSRWMTPVSCAQSRSYLVPGQKIQIRYLDGTTMGVLGDRIEREKTLDCVVRYCVSNSRGDEVRVTDINSLDRFIPIKDILDLRLVKK